MIRSLLFIVALCCAQGLLAQTPVVITEQNTRFNQPGDMPSWSFLQSTSLEIPGPGENQVWDYSQEQNGPGGYVVEYMAADNPAFPDASVAYNSYYALNQFELTGQAFFEARAAGEYYVGNAYDAATFDLGIGTLEVPEQTNHMAGSTDLQLPASVGLNWTTENKLPLNTLLTVPSAGLNNASLTYVQTRTFYDSIIGSGKLTMPGGGTYDVLLKKQIWIQVDSFLLYGQPAPEALLSLFGVEQGATSSTEYYMFYTPGVSTEIMLFTVGPNGSGVSYRDDLSASGVREPEVAEIAPRFHPNPVSGGEASLEFEKSSNARWSVAIVNMLGETLRTIPVDQPAGEARVKIEMNESTPSGSYYYEIRDEQGTRKASGAFTLTGK